jgi:gliding motility-associated-like protein
MRWLTPIIGFLFFLPIVLFATHNRAGEITYEQIGTRTIRATITTYTKISAQIDRDSIPVEWGDGTSENVSLAPGFPIIFTNGNDIQRAVYIAEHTYPGPGSYNISFEDPFRNVGINNIAKSDEVPMTLQSLVRLSPFLGENNSVELLNPPIDEACVGQVYEHNPGAFDEDGDSIYYSLTVPLGADKEPIESYFLPDGVTIDPVEGTLVWDRPEFAGEYNFAILIEEFRNGFKVGEVVRDMQVTVEECDNLPPIITSETTYCVIAGDTLNFEVFATDADSNDIITLSASGGPLSEVSAPLASFPNGTSSTDTVRGTFRWATNCDHIRTENYTVTFRAQDNNPDAQLVDVHTVNIKVIAPPPSVQIANVDQNGIELNWTPSACTDVVEYEVYRKQDSINYEVDSCSTGMPESWGYTLIGSGSTDTTLLDNPTSGNTYCYRVVAVHSDGSRSIVSNRVCATPPWIHPVVILNSVSATDISSGELNIAWRIPRDIITIGDTTGWKYQVIDRDGNILGTTSSLSDTTWLVQNFNTVESDFEVVIQILDNSDNFILESAPSSSVFASAGAGNQQVSLSWVINEIPWTNYAFEIQIEANGFFIPVGVTTGNSAIVDGLNNNQEYCFRILSVGQYSDPKITDTIFNFSQIVCATPQDTTPPCLPDVNITTDCENGSISILWQYQNDSCDADWAETRVYQKPTLDGEFQLIETVTIRNQEGITLENQDEIVGCYAIQVVDTAGNVSAIVQDSCIEHCAILRMPNLFTPGMNGFNDLVNPVIIRQIASLETTIYNRWGRRVYQSNELQIDWDGTIQSTGANAADGVYFYVCVATINGLSGPIELVYNGYIELIRD